MKEGRVAMITRTFLLLALTLVTVAPSVASARSAEVVAALQSGGAVRLLESAGGQRILEAALGRNAAQALRGQPLANRQEALAVALSNDSNRALRESVLGAARSLEQVSNAAEINRLALRSATEIEAIATSLRTDVAAAGAQPGARVSGRAMIRTGAPRAQEAGLSNVANFAEAKAALQAQVTAGKISAADVAKFEEGVAALARVTANDNAEIIGDGAAACIRGFTQPAAIQHVAGTIFGGASGATSLVNGAERMRASMARAYGETPAAANDRLCGLAAIPGSQCRIVGSGVARAAGCRM